MSAGTTSVSDLSDITTTLPMACGHPLHADLSNPDCTSEC